MSSSHKMTFQRGCMNYLPRSLSRTAADGTRITWQADLRRLCQARLSDAQVARLLTQLYPSHPTSPWKVWYYRQQLLLADADISPAQRQRLTANRYQIERGLGDLLPRPDQELGPYWQPGFELTRRQTDLLCCLRAAGALAFDELVKRLKVDKARVSRLLSVLIFLRLVERSQQGRYRPCC